MRLRRLLDFIIRSTNSQTMTCIGTETMMIPTIAPGLPRRNRNAANVAVSNVTIPQNSAIENFMTSTSENARPMDPTNSETVVRPIAPNIERVLFSRKTPCSSWQRLPRLGVNANAIESVASRKTSLPLSYPAHNSIVTIVTNSCSKRLIGGTRMNFTKAWDYRTAAVLTQKLAPLENSRIQSYITSQHDNG